MNLVGQVLENRYKLREPLGVGGMGTVYLAKHVLLGEDCAVKVLSPRFAFDPEWVDRFLLEARAAIRIRHANVVQVKDFACPEPGLVYMVMEAISGESLSDLLKREGAVSWQRALKMADHVASALEAAHACGIIHRDIKPSNCIRTTSCGDTDFIKVLDFGIAKFTASTDEGAHAPRTATGVWMGTAEYMAPEMYRGEPPDGRVDIYALGALIYKLITGETPYQGTHIEVAVEQSQRSPTYPSRRAPERNVPASVDTLVLRALARDLHSRTPSMTVLREEIAAALTSPAEVSLVIDVEEYAPTVVRKIDLPARHIPTEPAPSASARPPTPAKPPAPANPPISPATNLPVPAKPPASPATNLPVPAKPPASPATNLPVPAKPPTSPASNPPALAKPPAAASPARPPVRSPTQPLSPPRSVATQTGPRRAVSASLPPVPATEVTPSRRPTWRTPLTAAALSGIIALSTIVWRVMAGSATEAGTRAEPATDGIPPELDPHAPAPATAPALTPAATSPMDQPSATTPVPAPVAPALQPTATPPDETIVLDETLPTERSTSKPKPPRKKPTEPPVVDQRPLTVTAKDVEDALNKIQRECLAWGVPRGRRATLNITITSDGTATYQKVGMSDPYFVDCLNKKLKQAPFPQSQNGGSFRRDFVCG